MVKSHAWPNLIWQPLIAVVFIAVLLFFMDQFASSDVLWAVGAGSLSSSCYIVFGNPSAAAGQPGKIIGGYLIGIFTGFIIRFVIMQLSDFQCGLVGIPHLYIIGILASISVGLCLFFMSYLKVQHPPAAGMALVLVVDLQDYNEIILVILAALCLSLIRKLLCNRLIDLV